MELCPCVCRRVREAIMRTSTAGCCPCEGQNKPARWRTKRMLFDIGWSDNVLTRRSPTNYFKREASNHFKREASNYFKREASNYVKREASNYVKREASNYVKREASNYVKREASNYVKREASNYFRNVTLPLVVRRCFAFGCTRVSEIGFEINRECTGNT